MRVKIKNVYYCKHPDFIQDDSDPKGYKVLDTASWVVEWDVLPYYFNPLALVQKKHFRAKFATEEQARIFYIRIMRHTTPEGYIPEFENDPYVLS